MYAVDINGRKLEFAGANIWFGDQCLPLDQIQGLLVVRTDSYVNGAWVSGKRVIGLRAGDRTLYIDCSSVLPDRDKLNRKFGSAIGPVWETVGTRLVEESIARLAEGDTIDIGSVSLTREGAWVDGSWKFLWWKAKRRFVPWNQLKIFSDEGVLFLSSKTDLSFRSEVDINQTENALVLDAVVRSIIEREGWKN